MFGTLMIKGEAVVKYYPTEEYSEYDEDNEEEYFDEYWNSEATVYGSDLKKFDGIEDDNSIFSEYFHGPSEYDSRPGQKGLGVVGGILFFEYDKNSQKLYAVTKYDLERELTKDEIEIIAEYTSGQWSDGIGENWEQQPIKIDGVEYFLSAWHPNQELIKIQSETKKENLYV